MKFIGRDEVRGGVGGAGQILTSQPGIVKGPATTVFSKDETISRCLWTLTGKNRGSETDTEAMGLNLYLPLHQDDLKGPTLQPAQSEGIGQTGSLLESSPYGP